MCWLIGLERGRHVGLLKAADEFSVFLHRNFRLKIGNLEESIFPDCMSSFLSPHLTPEDSVVRRLHIPYSQHRPLFTALPSTGTGTDMRGDYREMPSSDHHQSNLLQFTEDGFHPNIPDVRRSQLGITGRQGEGGGIFPSQSQHRGQNVERWQEAAQSGRSYYPPAVIVRKSSHIQAPRPFHEGFPVWDPKGAQRSNTGQTVQGRDAPTVAEEKNFWQPSDLSRFSPHTARHSPPPSKGHYSGHKETNELAAVGPLSEPRAIQSSKVSSFTSQTAPHGPSVRNSFDTSAAKSQPSPGNLPSSISHSSETPRYKAAQSYLFRDSPSPPAGPETVDPVAADGHDVFSPSAYKQRLSDARAYGGPSSERNQPRRAQHVRFYRANSLHPKAKVDQYSAQTHSFTTARAQISAQPVSGRKASNSTDSEKSAARSLFNLTARGQTHAGNPGRTTKSIYGFRGFRPTWRTGMEPLSLSSSGSNKRFTSGRHSFNKGRFQMVNVHPSKYSFASRTSTNDSSPSPGMLGAVQTTATSRPLGFQEAGPLLPASDAHMDSNPDGRPSKSDRRIYGLKGFGVRPLEGAKPLIKEPHQNARVQQGFRGFQFRSSGSSRIHRWDNKTGPGSRREPSRDLKQVLKPEADGQFTPDEYKKRSKTYTHLGFDPGQTGNSNSTSKVPWKHKDRTSAGHSVSPTHLSSDRGVDPRPESEPLPAHLPSTRSEVRGQRVGGNATRKKLESLTSKDGNAAIARLPSRLARLKAVTYTDIMGSASFSGVRGTIQIPVTPADKDYSPTAMTHQEEVAGNWTLNSEDAVQSRGNASRSPEAHTDGEEDGDMSSSDLFLDNEGSGSEAFNTSDVFSSRMSQRLGGDLLELDYLRISTGNISFKSVKQSHAEK